MLREEERDAITEREQAQRIRKALEGRRMPSVEEVIEIQRRKHKALYERSNHDPE